MLTSEIKLAKVRDYKLKNKELLKIKAQEYYLKNKEIMLEKVRLYNNTHKEECNVRRNIKRNEYRINNPKEDLRGRKSKGGYNITLAERNKTQWIEDVILFYKLKMIEDNGDIFYKYGLTNNINRRLASIPYNCEIIFAEQINKYDGTYKEIEYLKNVNKYKPKKFFRGYTECFK